MAKWEEHRDKPIDEIKKLADDTIDKFKARGAGDAKVYFKFTCQHCGERNTFEEPNTLYRSGTCGDCGRVTIIQRAGFTLAVHFNE